MYIHLFILVCQQKSKYFHTQKQSFSLGNLNVSENSQFYGSHVAPEKIGWLQQVLEMMPVCFHTCS